MNKEEICIYLNKDIIKKILNHVKNIKFKYYPLKTRLVCKYFYNNFPLTDEQIDRICIKYLIKRPHLIPRTKVELKNIVFSGQIEDSLRYKNHIDKIKEQSKIRENRVKRNVILNGENNVLVGRVNRIRTITPIPIHNMMSLEYELPSDKWNIIIKDGEKKEEKKEEVPILIFKRKGYITKKVKLRGDPVGCRSLKGSEWGSFYFYDSRIIDIIRSKVVLNTNVLYIDYYWGQAYVRFKHENNFSWCRFDIKTWLLSRFL